MTNRFIEDRISRADEIADALLGERNRLLQERAKFLLLAGLTSGPFFQDPLGARERADSALAVIEQIERHVGTVMPRLAETARANSDEGAADRLLVRSAAILEAVTGVRVEDDAINDARETVRAIASEFKVAAVGVGAIVAVAAVVYAVTVLGRK